MCRPAILLQSLGVDAPLLIAQLDPVARERVLSLYVHEGDWEGVSVRLDPSGGVRDVVYWAHGKPVVDRQSMRQTIDGIDRIVVDVAMGSHACGRAREHGPGAHVLDPAARLLAEMFAGPTGTNWRTWRNLRPAGSAAWYGFGGAWGRPRLPPVGSLARRRFQAMDIWVESTGPLGPGPAKLARNHQALRSTAAGS
jgi:hypothetical protein